MKPKTSLFLDEWRIAAAFVVFLYHCGYLWYPAGNAIPDRIAHGGVVVFFVLSGYLIAYSTREKARGAPDYAFARLSRLLSVAVPAILLTGLLLIVGSRLNPSYYHAIGRGHVASRFFLISTFCQNLWFMSASPPSNAPFWSLSYEFWYYALWGAWLWIPTAARWGRWGRLALALFIGPDIMILFPCWLIGAWAYRCRRPERSGASAAPTVCVCALLALLATVIFVPSLPFRVGRTHLNMSASFLTDWLTAALMALAIVAFDRSQGSAPPPAGLARTVRFAASRTYSLYLYHYPLLVFATATLKLHNPGWFRAFWIAAGAIAITLILSQYTERKRHAWEMGLRRLAATVSGFGRPPPGAPAFCKIRPPRT